MPSNDDLDRLAVLAREAAANQRWGSFANYLALRSQGRRAEALRALKEFLEDAKAWPFAERLALLRWIGRTNEFRPFDNLLIPQPLLIQLVSPTAREYLSCKPECAQANFLFTLYVATIEANAKPLQYLKRAVQLDPTHQASRTIFINWVTGHAENAQHELPWYGYLGQVDEDISDLQEASSIAQGIHDIEVRQIYISEITELLETAVAWKAFTRQKGEADFTAWCTRAQTQSAG